MAKKKNDLSFESELRVSFAKEYQELKVTSPYKAYSEALKRWQIAEKKSRDAWENYIKLQNTLETDSSEYYDKIHALQAKCSNLAEYMAINYLLRLDD